MSALAPNAAPAKKSRAQEISDKKYATAQLATAAAQMAALEAQMAALKAGPVDVLESTLDQSLKEKLAAVHAEDNEQLRQYNAMISDGKYTDDDLFELAFWESGVARPVEPKDSDPKDFKSALALCKKWEEAYDLIDGVFCKRALLAYELKIVYKMQREQVRTLATLLAHCSHTARTLLRLMRR